MGLFSARCSVSGLPIIGGEDVRFFLLNEDPYKDEGIMLGQWAPRTFPVKAKYNYYGTVEDVEPGIIKDSWMKGFQVDLIEKELGENEYHDVPVSKDMSFEDLLTAVLEERVDVESTIENIDGFSLLFAASRGSDEVVELFPEETNRLPTVAENSHPVRVFQSFIREDVYQALLLTNPFKDKTVFCKPDDRRLGDWYPMTVGLGYHRHLMGTLTPEEAEPIADFYSVIRALTALGHDWTPSYHTGPQLGEYDAHAQFSIEVAKIAVGLAKKPPEEGEP